jgi:hypothetical protein
MKYINIIVIEKFLSDLRMLVIIFDETRIRSPDVVILNMIFLKKFLGGRNYVHQTKRYFASASRL